MVTRYNLDCEGGCMSEHKQGYYVDYSDYEELEEALSDYQDSLKESQDKYDALVESIRDLYRNA